ncbi:MAG: 50S ribosomal protein L5 [Candidatus Woesearchaeota archaeon]
MKDENPMRKISVEKLTINIGVGKDQQKLEKAEKLLKQITGIPPVRTKTDKRIASWGLRPGLPIGCKLTLRGEEAMAMIPRLLSALEFKLDDNNFDENGNISFGIKEYIDIRDAKYDPEIGILGLQASITLKRPGFRIKQRKMFKKTIPIKHRIARSEAMNFMKENFDVKFIKDEDN